MSSQIERYDQHTNLLREYANRLLALQLNEEWEGSAEELMLKARSWLIEHSLALRPIRVFSSRDIPKQVGEAPASEYIAAQLDRRGLSVLKEVEKMCNEVLKLQMSASAEGPSNSHSSRLEQQKQELAAQLEQVKRGASVYILEAIPKGLSHYQRRSRLLLVNSDNLRKDFYSHITNLLRLFIRPLPDKYRTLPVMLEASLQLWEAGGCYYWLGEREMWVMSRPNIESLFIEAAEAEKLLAKQIAQLTSKQKK